MALSKAFCLGLLTLLVASLARGREVVDEGDASAASECSLCDDDCLDCCDECESPTSNLFVTAEALFLQLDRGTNNPVPVVLDQNTGDTILTTHDLNYDLEVGPRFGVGCQVNDTQVFEATYFGMHHWEEGAVAAGNNNLRLPGDLALATLDFFDADLMRLTSTTELHTVEANYRHFTTLDNLSLLAGFRCLSFDDTFNIRSFDLDSGESDYNIAAYNRLYGGQLGARYRKIGDRFGIDLIGKAGLFGNAAKQRTFVGDFDNTFDLRRSTTSGSRAAFVGELGLNGIYKFTDVLHFRAGYNLLWIEGIARAMDQLDFTDTPNSGTALVFGSGAFLHGFSVGLEATW